MELKKTPRRSGMAQISMLWHFVVCGCKTGHCKHLLSKNSNKSVIRLKREPNHPSVNTEFRGCPIKPLLIETCVQVVGF